MIRSLFSNPLLVAPIAGLLWSASGWVLYNPLEQCIVFLAAAASPCALVSIGLFLMQKGKVTTHGAWSISLTKLIAQPLLAWIIAVPILDLPRLWVNAVMILSALPTGTGPFMLAQYYHDKADGSLIARVVLITTVGSLLSISIFLWWNNRI